jgi:hypothetical protein
MRDDVLVGITDVGVGVTDVPAGEIPTNDPYLKNNP